MLGRTGERNLDVDPDKRRPGEPLPVSGAYKLPSLRYQASICLSQNTVISQDVPWGHQAAQLDGRTPCPSWEMDGFRAFSICV